MDGILKSPRPPFKNLLKVVRLQVLARCGRKDPLRCDVVDLWNTIRIKKCITDTAVGGPYVEREHELSGGPAVR